MGRIAVLGLAALLAAPLSAATLGVSVPRLEAAPAAVLGTAFASAAPLLGLAAPPALQAAPSAVAALPPLPAAADGLSSPWVPQAPEAAAAAPAAAPAPAQGSAPDSEAEAARAGARFDGSDEAPPSASAVSPSPRGAGLKAAKEEHRAWLSSVVAALASTRTGRRVLRDVDALAAREGRPILIDVKAIGSNGEFRYDSDLLVMDSPHLKNDPRQSAPILAHELQHVLQRAMNLPTDALELEIESYTVENRVWNELGVEPEAGSFARQARRRITTDFAAFAGWLGREYKKNVPLHGSTIDAYVARLKTKLANAERAEARTRRKRASVERTLESMRANRMSEDAIAAHVREDLEPLDRSLRDSAASRGWIERDLRLLADPAARERFRAYARGVIRRARALSKS